MVAVDKTSTGCQVALAERASLKSVEHFQMTPVKQMVLLLDLLSKIILFLGKKNDLPEGKLQNVQYLAAVKDKRVCYFGLLRFGMDFSGF